MPDGIDIIARYEGEKRAMPTTSATILGRNATMLARFARRSVYEIQRQHKFVDGTIRIFTLE